MCRTEINPDMTPIKAMTKSQENIAMTIIILLLTTMVAMFPQIYPVVVFLAIVVATIIIIPLLLIIPLIYMTTPTGAHTLNPDMTPKKPISNTTVTVFMSIVAFVSTLALIAFPQMLSTLAFLICVLLLLVLVPLVIIVPMIYITHPDTTYQVLSEPMDSLSAYVIYVAAYILSGFLFGLIYTVATSFTDIPKPLWM